MRKAMLFVILLFLMSVSVLAQSNECPADVEPVLTATLDECRSAAPGTLCYGSGDVTLTSVGEMPNFDALGTAINFSNIQAMTLASVDGTPASVLARLPLGISSDATEMLIFGDVTVNNQITGVPLPLPPRLTVTATANANIRNQPSKSASVVTVLSAGSSLTAVGRSEDNLWIRVLLPDLPDEVGWVFSELVTTSADVSSLNVATPTDVVPVFPDYLPMQSITLQPTGESTCGDQVSGGILVQTPSDDSPITLLVNGYELILKQATALLESNAESLTIRLFEGNGVARSGGISHFVPAGAELRLLPEAAETILPAPYERQAVIDVPTEQMERPISIPEPLTEAGIQALWLNPLPGTWLSYNPILQETCSGVSIIPGRPPRVTVALESEGQRLRIAGELDRDLIFSRRADGVYQMDFFGQPFEMRIVSPVRLEGQYDNVWETGGKTCVVTFGYYLDWVG